jgi:site-specific recombinase XerD
MKTYSLRFFLRDSKKSGDLSKIFGRITATGVRQDFSINRKIDPKLWDSNASKVKGRKDADRELEKYLSTIEELFYKVERALIEKSQPVTATNLIQGYYNLVKGVTDEKTKMLFEVFDLHNKKMEELVKAGEIVRHTFLRYETTKTYLQEFLEEKYSIKDISLSELQLVYANEFDHWLRIRKNCAHNTVVKYIKNLRKIIRMAIDNSWMQVDPFRLYQAKTKPVNVQALTIEDLRKIENLKCSIPRIENVRKLFLFCCYTGLSYVDMISLTIENLVIDNEGDKWIIKPRHKTNVTSRIYLLPAAEKLLKSYDKHPAAVYNGTLLPPISNQRLNSYLKEIADLAGIKKKLTSHCGRHTFATTVGLANGVSLESVSSQLGHTNIRQTQHYARMVDSRIGREMSTLRTLFS